MRKNSTIQDLLDSKKTCVVKATSTSNICISYEYIDKLKLEVLAFLESKRFKWDYSNSTILINYWNIRLRRRHCKLVDELTYVTLPVKYEGIFFEPKVGSTCLAKIVGFDLCKIKLSFFDVIKGILYIKDSEAGNSIKTRIDCINVAGQSKQMLSIDMGGNCHRIEENKFVKVIITDCVISNTKDAFLICNLDLNSN